MGILRNLLSAAAAYVPTEWATGDVITADKLNHIERGISDTNLVVPEYTFNIGTSELTCNMTFAEIIEAYNNKTLAPYCKYIDGVSHGYYNAISFLDYGEDDGLAMVRYSAVEVYDLTDAQQVTVTRLRYIEIIHTTEELSRINIVKIIDDGTSA